MKCDILKCEHLKDAERRVADRVPFAVLAFNCKNKGDPISVQKNVINACGDKRNKKGYCKTWLDCPLAGKDSQ